MSYQIAGAEWCPWSQRQASELGCTTVDGKTTCKATQENKQVEFVWCQDKNRQPINTEHDICKKINEQKVNIGGYPAWFEDAEVADNMGGFMDPCQVPGMDKGILNCDMKEAANQTCKQAQEEAKQATTELQKELQESSKALEAEINQLKEAKLGPLLQRLKTETEPFQSTCTTAQEAAKPKWG